MSLIEELLAVNERYAAAFQKGELPPAKRLAIVTCVNDPWLRPGAGPQPHRPGLQGSLTGAHCPVGQSSAVAGLVDRPDLLPLLDDEAQPLLAAQASAFSLKKGIPQES